MAPSHPRSIRTFRFGLSFQPRLARVRVSLTVLVRRMTGSFSFAGKKKKRKPEEKSKKESVLRFGPKGRKPSTGRRDAESFPLDTTDGPGVEKGFLAFEDFLLWKWKWKVKNCDCDCCVQVSVQVHTILLQVF
jgi:hypothetical protein